VLTRLSIDLLLGVRANLPFFEDILFRAELQELSLEKKARHGAFRFRPKLVVA
jgi:hypothetical protein